MSTPSTPSPRLSRRPCTSYVAVFLALTIGAVWGLCLFYLLNHEFAAAVLGPLVLTNPVVMLVLHSPARLRRSSRRGQFPANSRSASP